MNKMSDEEIIKRRLLIDGDGTGDDRRLNVLLKQFLKWTYSKNDSPENNHVIYDRLLAQLAQCEFTAAKSQYALKMIQQELKNYEKNSTSIEKGIELAKKEIEDSKLALVQAKQIRKNKMEYDMLAKVIKEQPDRKDTHKQIETLKKELNELVGKKMKLERKFQKRRNDFTLLMYSLRELEATLDEDSSSDSSSSENELDVMDLSEDEALIEGPTQLKVEPVLIDDVSKESTLIDEDAVLELSIEKDDAVVKLDEVALIS